MVIEKLERFSSPIHLLGGDTFRLYNNDELVHSVNITGVETITCWALVRIGNSIGYFIGDDNLERDLKCPDCGSPKRDLTTPKQEM